MAATGTEAISLSQLKTYAGSVDTALDAKITAPDAAGTSGQVLTIASNGEEIIWATPSTSTVDSATILTTLYNSGGVVNPLYINITDEELRIYDATATQKGVVIFASDTDFAEYMGIA